MVPAIFGIAGLRLTDDERAFFRDADPAGYILFGRNVQDRSQLRALTDELRAIEGRDKLFICIDQEGGRVARMKPPEWLAFPPGEVFDRLYEIAPASAIEAARANARALGMDLAEAGVTVDCLPLLDVRQPGAHDVIGDRALGSEPLRVAALGRAVLVGLETAGVAGVVKHIPGHGRAMADSHKALPTVEASEQELETDLAPFRALAGARIGMTAHVRYTAWDAENPATLSPFVIAEIIRGRIGFDGLRCPAQCPNAPRVPLPPVATSRSTAGRRWTTWSASPTCCPTCPMPLRQGSIARSRIRASILPTWQCRRS